MSLLGDILNVSGSDFAGELHDLIDRYRFNPAIALEELVDALEDEAEALVEEVNARSA
jgi:hypothetical protein